MEPVAVNHVIITPELFAESHEATFPAKRPKTLLYCGIIFCAFGLVMLALQSRMPAAAGMYLPMLLTGAAVILWSLTMKRSDLRKKSRAFRQRNGESAERTITCDRTGRTIDTGRDKPIRIEYTEIRDHRETAHLYLLLCSGHRGVQLAKDGFETGSWDALLKAAEKAKQEAEALQELI